MLPAMFGAPSELMLTVVAPDTLPVITSLSEPRLFGAKFASRAMTPPPSKLPDTVSVSPVSESSPTSSVPPGSTFSVPTVRVRAPLPKLILARRPTLISSQPVTFSAFSEPDTLFLKASLLLLLFPEAASVPMLAMLARSNVRLSELAASLIVPLSVAPFLTSTLSHPFSPLVARVVLRRPVASLLNTSTSLEPPPPSISVTAPKLPPLNSRWSFPPPRLILPATVAPVFTVTVLLPAPPVIAFRAPAPTDAPL